MLEFVTQVHKRQNWMLTTSMYMLVMYCSIINYSNKMALMQRNVSNQGQCSTKACHTDYFHLVSLTSGSYNNYAKRIRNNRTLQNLPKHNNKSRSASLQHTSTKTAKVLRVAIDFNVEHKRSSLLRWINGLTEQ